MYAGRQYTSNVSALQRHAFVCGRCNHQAIAVIVGLGTGSGASPFFLDDKGAQQRAQAAAQVAADREIKRGLEVAACPKCGHVDPHAVRMRRRTAVFTAIGMTLAGLAIAAVVAAGGLIGLGIGAGAGLLVGAIMAIVGLTKTTPVIFESSSVR